MGLFSKVKSMLYGRGSKFDVRRDYVETFSSPHGARTLAHILAAAGVTDPVLTSDKDQLLIQEGQRRVALSIYRYASTSNELLLKLLDDETHRREAQQKEQET